MNLLTILLIVICTVVVAVAFLGIIISILVLFSITDAWNREKVDEEKTL